ncbi:hypothetical protein BV898_05663 [Hypsibius exemplaris]|uniref:Uncharacterized protein n=1 Tax=Hypsibius exemplaris TaxID=2072580 RepID=A0A1W0WYU8_HYPEX|nr:hypothetical protein BV898_05663 [Hypsibius exemplaris]
MGFLEETFQLEFNEKTARKDELTLEFAQKGEEVEENKQKLIQLEAQFKVKIAAQKNEMEKARKLRRQQEKLLKDGKKHNRKERKRIEQELADQRARLEEAKRFLQGTLAAHKRTIHQNQEVKAELAEIHLAVKIIYELLPGDEERRHLAEDELLQKSSAAVAIFRVRYDRLVDQISLCSQFAADKAKMRVQFADELRELRRVVLIELQDCKVQFHVDFSAYQMLMWHRRRSDRLRSSVMEYGHEQRTREQQRAKVMSEYAREKRRELEEAVTANFRASRKYYHLNVIHHILHVESVRKFLQNHAVEDGYKSAIELLASEKIFKVYMQEELAEREHFWCARMKRYARHLNGNLSTLTGIHEEMLVRSDDMWDSLKSEVIEKQKLKLQGDVEQLFEEKLRKSWTWVQKDSQAKLPKTIGEGDASFYDDDDYNDVGYISAVPLDVLQ